MFFILVLLLTVVNIDGAREGEVCAHNNISGVCVEITKCQNMVENPIFWKFSPACQSRGSLDVVCCDTSNKIQRDSCEPIPASITTRKTGRKAWDKCIEYQQLVYPCVNGVRQRMCSHDAVAPFLSSTHAKRHEFPHAVLLGYTNQRKQLDWLCGGALVSAQYVLTAGHCVDTRVSGPVTHVAIHPTDRSDIEPASIYKVQRVIKHPEFRPPRTYHDLALLHLERPVPLSSTTVPACLVLNGEPSVIHELDDPPTVTATTWNTNDVLGTGITWLRKINLNRYSIDDCSRLYPESRRGGYNATTQLCYGDQAGAKDFCQDDGGSPLVVENGRLSCMYSVVGVTSYGKGCLAHNPGVYTRLHHYTPWIETVVWP